MVDNPADVLTSAVQRHIETRDAVKAEAQRLAEQRIRERQQEADRGTGADTQ